METQDDAVLREFGKLLQAHEICSADKEFVQQYFDEKEKYQAQCCEFCELPEYMKEYIRTIMLRADILAKIKKRMESDR